MYASTLKELLKVIQLKHIRIGVDFELTSDFEIHDDGR